MAKNISIRDLPDGVTYHIDSHNGYNGPEHEPHVKIYGNGCDVKYSIRTGRRIEGKFGNRNYERQIEEWVRNHISELNDEWNESNDPKGGR